MPSRSRLLTAGVVALAVLLVDQLTKAWATASLPPGGGRVVAVQGWIWFRLLRNTGATFSLLPNYNLLFGAATALVIVAIALTLQRGYVSDRFSALALGVVAGGAFGNLLDRVRFAAVTDFIQVRIWPTYFNLADVAIRLGVLSFVIGLLLAGRRPRQSA